KKLRKETEVPSPSSEVLDLEKVKTAQAKEIVDLKKRKKQKSRKKLRKETEVPSPSSEVPNEKSVPTTSNDPLPSGRMNEEEMFRVNDLDGDEVIVGATASEEVEQSTKVTEKNVSIADPVTTTGEVVTTTKGVEVTTAATTLQISKDELTLAHTLIKIKG
nr:hypothetical protein [Tanacetum cinerariifolium]